VLCLCVPKIKGLLLHNQSNLTPWSKVLLEKLIVYQLFNKFPAFYGKMKVHYHVHKNLPLSQINPVYILLCSDWEEE
jgi:hypothetical protein